MTTTTTPMSICRDEDCPACGWPETYAAGTVETGPDHVGCRKCGWTRSLSLTCDGWCDKTGEVAMIDTAGFAYCEPCGLRRRESEPCRKLRPHELRRLQRGEQLARY